MNPSDISRSTRHASRGWALYGVAGGAVLGLLAAVSSSPPGAHDMPLSEPVQVDTAPALPPTQVAALDAGVDWSRVERAEDAGPLAIAAYDR